ncbi:RFC checkpoint protein Rad17, partial [Teratosphaeriaceae sp. CCFEE 6253]
PRASRRKVVASDSDDEEPAGEKPADDSESSGVRSSRTAKPKAVSKVKRTQQPTPSSSFPDFSSQTSPGRSKTSKTKSNAASKEPMPPKGKPIYSFFNAATQRQTLSQQPSASPEKPQQDEPETIHDDSDDKGSSLSLSKGSSVALVVRKRKAQHVVDVRDEANFEPSATQKFRKTNGGGRTPSIAVVNEDKRPWTEQFAPVDLTELAVHKRKVADVRQWLEAALNGKRQKVLVLKGQAGTGKTATLRLLARELMAELAEWQNPAGADMTAEGSASAATHFEDFIRRAGKAASLSFAAADARESTYTQSGPSDPNGVERPKQILLVEEFPNTFSRTSATLQSFRSTILQYVSSPAVQDTTITPIVMIISETLLSTNTAAADSFTAHRLLGPELVNHPLVNTIEFNAVAPTILTKALECVVVKEARKSGRRKTPGPPVIKRLAETGDIRSAVASLEFLCLRGDDTDAWSSKVQFTKPKKKPAESAMTKAEEDALKLVSNRESSLGIFHAVGRVVYNNRVDVVPSQTLAHPPPWLPQHRRVKVPERDIDALIDELGTDTSTFIAALHENYVLSCGSSSAEDALDSLSGCADSVSDADLLSVDRFQFGTLAFSGSVVSGLRQDEMAFQVAVRGLQFSLPFPVHRSGSAGNKADAHRMFYPTSLKLWKTKEEMEGIVELLTAQIQTGKIDTARSSHPSRASARGYGVESWSRSNVFGTAPAQQTESDQTDHPRVTSAKGEMLLERLPYQAQLLAARQHGSEPSAFSTQVSRVTRVSERALKATDDASAEDDDEIAAPTESWATDQPELDVELSEQKTNLKGKPKSKTARGSLAMPVETRVATLVLEDDDIVDD